MPAKYAPLLTSYLLFLGLLLPLNTTSAETSSQDVKALQKQVEALQQQLKAAERKLSDAERERQQAEQRAEQAEIAVTNDNDEPKKDPLQFGPLKIGGAMRANYVVGDYPRSDSGAASRAVEDGGDFALDTFRINLDYQKGNWLGKVEYRWYQGYNFLHTGWVGYQFDEDRQLQVGVNRVPFGPGPYGVSQSWLFDQHYYLGLSDDMDLGVKFTQKLGKLQLDTAYYITDEGAYKGGSKDSARYSYDVVNESDNGYEERHQFNVRAIYSFEGDDLNTDLGISLQYSELESKGIQSDGDHHAASVHMINKWNNFTLASQITYYEFDVSSLQPLGTDTLIQMGAYDFPSTAAARGWIPAVSLSYYHKTNNLPWLDYVIPYIEYSSLIKTESEFNDSQLATLGAAFGYGNWYIYTDWAHSTGNEFVGGDTMFGDRLGANDEDEWESRFNINFGYYF
ncbi:MAG: FlxA-like family protein [Methylophaga sp.]